MKNGTHSNTSELRQNSFTDSEELEVGNKSSRRDEYAAEKTEQRAIYDLLVRILKTFQLSTKGNANRAMKKLVKNSAKPSDHGDSVNETVTV